MPSTSTASPAEDAERTRWALDRAAALARGSVEARTLTHLRGARWGRLAAVAAARSATRPSRSCARCRRCRRTSRWASPCTPAAASTTPPDGRELVDGEIGTSFGIHTNTDDNPNVVIDLLGRYWIDTVKIHNRVDGWFDDCLPLVVELSQDGKKWEEIGRRDRALRASAPWVVDGGGRPASFVRVRVDRKSYLLLSEVEVFGKKG